VAAYQMIVKDNKEENCMSNDRRVPGKLRSGLFGMKLKSPSGIKLDNKETQQVIDLWKEDTKTIDDNTHNLLSAERAIESNLERLPDILNEVSTARNEACRYFKQTTKDPIKKREWARRLVVADRAYESIKASKKRMDGVMIRIRGVVRDAALEKRALEVRISEAEAYVKMGKGLSLVGDTLIAARTRASNVDIEFSLLELGTENIENTVLKMKNDDLIREAERLI
jgi:hypothetical protein